MASLIYLDTHVVVWLYLPRLDLLSGRARDALEEHDLLVSPAVVLELAYLRETGRLRAGAEEVMESLHDQLGLERCPLPFDDVVDSALDESWTRDPFDRLIVAQAAASGRELVTKDDTIRDHYRHALW